MNFKPLPWLWAVLAHSNIQVLIWKDRSFELLWLAISYACAWLKLCFLIYFSHGLDILLYSCKNGQDHALNKLFNVILVRPSHFAESSVADFFHTLKRQFTDQEWRTIRNKHTEMEQLKMFYRFWVRMRKIRVRFPAYPHRMWALWWQGG